jgi:hypothetical protein
MAGHSPSILAVAGEEDEKPGVAFHNSKDRQELQKTNQHSQ